MNIQILCNGDLEMSADKQEIKRLKKSYKPFYLESKEQHFIYAFLLHYGYTPIKPEDAGCLTSAPLITDGETVWGFMNYQVESFLETLANGKSVIWTRG